MSLPPIPEAEFSQHWHEFFTALLIELEARKETSDLCCANNSAAITALQATVAALETNLQDQIDALDVRITALEP